MATLREGTADQLAARLRQLADYGAAKNPPPDSTLAQAVADARAYADHLDELAQLAAGVTVRESSDVFTTADALAGLIVEEGQSGAYANADPPPPADHSLPWWVPGAVVVGAGVLAFWGLRRKRGLLSQGTRLGLLSAVGL